MRSLLFYGLFLCGQFAAAQSKYWVFLKDKDSNTAPAISKKTIDQRLQAHLPAFDDTDLPLKNLYLDYFKSSGIKVISQSKWFNAVSATLSPNQVAQIKNLPFVKSVRLMNGDFQICRTNSSAKPQLAPVLEQIQANEFRRVGLTGKGVTIGVIDAGYYEAPVSSSLKHLFGRNAVLDKRDYVNPEHIAKFFTYAESFSDFHGTEVMNCIAGNDRMEGIQYGLATDAQFYLARTDHGTREWRGEEDYWVSAVEWLDSLGVRLINTSLGYAKGFSDPNENYEPSQMDGQTSIISKAAQMAADKKGILLIVSAGNEGDDPDWRIISTPADAEGVIAVGATNQKYWNRIGYSSIGPEFLKYMKPNVSCYSQLGTSLSAPVITGFAACLMQADPQLSSKQIRNIIEKSAHLYPYGNNYVGYGVPLASRALEFLKNTENTPPHARQILVADKIVSLPTTLETVSVFHKKNSVLVTEQEVVKVRNGQLFLNRHVNETHTTIDLKTEVIEIVWQN